MHASGVRSARNEKTSKLRAALFDNFLIGKPSQKEKILKKFIKAPQGTAFVFLAADEDEDGGDEEELFAG